MRLLIVDDHAMVCEGLQMALEAAGYSVVGVAHDGSSALALARRVLPDVAIVDLRLPDMNGDQLCRQLGARFPSTAVVILSAHLSEGAVRRCLHAGAVAYVSKTGGLRELGATLDRVEQARSAPSREPVQIIEHLYELVGQRGGPDRVTPHQRAVLELAAQGLSNAEIGKRLFIAESTARFHIQNLKAKVNARTKTELIAKALREGLLSTENELLSSPETTGGNPRRLSLLVPQPYPETIGDAPMPLADEAGRR